MRLRICFFLGSIGITGYLLFNKPGPGLVFVALSSFFGLAAAYSFNNITDTGEDMINGRRLSSFVTGRKGLVVVGLCSLLSLFFSFFLTLESVVFCLSGILFGIFYSTLKLKRYLLLKNFYTAFGGSLVFLLGATFLSVDVIMGYLVFSFFLFIASAISDLRDYEGDKAEKINTMAVRFGYRVARKVILVLVLLLSFFLVFSPLPVLEIPTLLIFFFLLKNKPVFAHSILGSSFVFSALWTLMVF